jgi:uncharacterized membrane protein (UPF0127 family)
MLKESVYILLCFIVLIIVLYRIKLSNTEGFYGNEPKTFTLHVKTAIDKQLGLMHRKNKLKKNHGLLFDYNRYGVFSFWMKDTLIPLEILCLDHQYKVIGLIKDLKPKSEKKRELDKPIRYAIELNKDTTRKNNINIGDQINLLNADTI